MLAILLLAWIITKTIHDGRVDHEYAKQGLVSPRMQAKYGPKAKDATAQYGFTDYLRDAWSDHWQGRAAALKKDRGTAPVVDPQRPSVTAKVPWRERWSAAKATAASVADRAGRVLVDPVGGDKSAMRPEPVPVTPLVESGDVPAGTVRHTDDGTEQWDGVAWRAVPEPATKPAAKPADALTRNEEADQPADATSAATTKPTGGPAMTAPTGEAVNYETTISELEAQATVQREHVDCSTAAVKSAQDMKSAVNNMQQSYRASSAAAASLSEHLTAKHLDGVTLANAGTAADAMPAGVVDQWYDHIEEVEAAAKERLAAAEVALAATEANLAHVRAEYGDAHAKVAGNLGGDASFLDSGGGTGGYPGGGPGGAEIRPQDRTLDRGSVRALLGDTAEGMRQDQAEMHARWAADRESPDFVPLGSPDSPQPSGTHRVDAVPRS